MCENKPENIDEYKRWLKKAHDFEIDRRIHNHFDAIALKVEKDFKKNVFWTELIKNIGVYNDSYLLKTKYPLFTNVNEPPQLHIKSFDSFLLKTFRHNVLTNKNFPEPPDSGWVTPTNWIEKANDVVRTCFVVKYLDGVEYLIEKLDSLAAKHGITLSRYYVAGEDGYYAAHVYITQTFEVPLLNFDTEQIEVKIELQITSQLQDVIRKMLHSHFEARRQMTKSPDVDWQWDYKSDEFATNYLGHILHYVEGMIMEVRDKGV